MPTSINPYIAGDPVGNSSAFVGREDVLREVLKVLRSPSQNAITLYGQRRIGKTSMLQYLRAHLPQEGAYRPVYFDLQDKAAWPLPRLLSELARAIAAELDLAAPQLSPDDTEPFRAWLRDALAQLPEESSLALLFDEFDVLADPRAGTAATEFFPYLRNLLILDPTRLQFVFVLGRNITDLSSFALAVFKGVLSKRVSLLNHADTFKLVRLSESNNTLFWPDNACEIVWDLTHGHPYLTQALCSQVWEAAYDESPGEAPRATPQMVEAAAPAVLDSSRNMLEWLWSGLGPAEKVVSAALAGAGREVVDDGRLEALLRESGVRIIIRELKNAPQLLTDWDILEPTNGGHVFRVELLRHWIAQYHPLSRTWDELDRIQPAAENLFNAAKSFYEQGDLAGAENLLVQAIRINPSHLKAHELLSEILIGSGRQDEARDKLEKLVEFAPSLARPRLIQIYIAQAEAATDDPTRIQLYEKILALDPSLARPRLIRIYLDQAEVAPNNQTRLARYEKILGLDPSHPEAHARVEKIKQLEQEEKELAYDFVEGRQALQRGEWAQAIERLQKVVAKRPEYTYDENETASDLLADAVREKKARLARWKVWLRQTQTLAFLGGVALILLMIFFGSFGQIAFQSCVNIRAGYCGTLAPSLTPTITASLTKTATPTITPTITPTFTFTLTSTSTLTVQPTIGSGNATQIAIVFKPSAHLKEVNSVAISKDGILASGSNDTTVALWNVSTGAWIKTLTGHADGVNALDFSPDGTMLAAAAGNGQVRIWDMKNVVSAQDIVPRILGNDPPLLSSALALDFSPSGKQLAVAYKEKIVLWEADTGKEIYSLPSKESADAHSVAFSRDGNFLAFGSENNVVILWDVDQQKIDRRFTGHTDVIDSISFSDDGKQLASGDNEGNITIWNLDTGQPKWFRTGHQGAVKSVTFSPGSQALASGGADKSIILWNTDTAQKIKTLSGHYASVNSLAYSPDGSILASGSSDYSVILWDTERGMPKQTLNRNTTEITAFAFTPDSKILAAGDTQGKIILWDMEKGSSWKTLQDRAAGKINIIKFFDAGKKLASGNNNEKQIVFWDVESGQRIATVSLDAPAKNLDFSPDGAKMVVGSGQNVTLWDISSADKPTNLKTASLDNEIGTLLYITDRQIIISSRNNSESNLNIWNGNESILNIYHLSTSKVYCNGYHYYGTYLEAIAILSQEYLLLSFSNTGYSNYTCSSFLISKFIRFFNLEKSTVDTLNYKGLENIDKSSGIQVSPDGKVFAGYSSNSVTLYGLDSDHLELVLIKNIDFAPSVRTISFSPNGKFLVVGLADGGINILAIP